MAGATGAQGGATARALLEAGVRVRALTRRPDSPAARRLSGADVVHADFTDQASLHKALAGVTALFAVSTPFETDVDREVADGMALLDAAAQEGVQHIVYTSAANADRHTGIPHFDSKRRIELHLAALGVPWTVIAPAAFMDQYAEEWTLRSLREGWFGRPMPADKPLPLICADDIGTFAALALTRPAEFAGRRVDIAGDVCTGAEIAATLGRATGRAVEYRELPPAYIARHSADLAAMFAYFGTTGLDVDVARLRHDHPEVHWRSLAEWTQGQSWGLDVD